MHIDVFGFGVEIHNASIICIIKEDVYRFLVRIQRNSISSRGREFGGKGIAHAESFNFGRTGAIGSASAFS